MDNGILYHHPVIRRYRQGTSSCLEWGKMAVPKGMRDSSDSDSADSGTICYDLSESDIISSDLSGYDTAYSDYSDSDFPDSESSECVLSDSDDKWEIDKQSLYLSKLSWRQLSLIEWQKITGRLDRWPGKPNELICITGLRGW